LLSRLLYQIEDPETYSFVDTTRTCKPVNFGFWYNTYRIHQFSLSILFQCDYTYFDPWYDAWRTYIASKHIIHTNLTKWD